MQSSLAGSKISQVACQIEGGEVRNDMLLNEVFVRIARWLERNLMKSKERPSGTSSAD